MQAQSSWAKGRSALIFWISALLCVVLLAVDISVHGLVHGLVDLWFFGGGFGLASWGLIKPVTTEK